MLRVGRPDGLDTTSLWSVMVVGGPLSESYILELRDLLPGAFTLLVYGQSEIGGVLTVFKTNKVKESLMLHYKPNSVGTPMYGFDFKVIIFYFHEIIIFILVYE